MIKDCNISINNSPWDYVRGTALLHGLQFCSKENIYFKENIGTRVSEWKNETTEVIPAGTSIEKEVDWKGLCGGINNGEHRVILMVNGKPIACEFSK